MIIIISMGSRIFNKSGVVIIIIVIRVINSGIKIFGYSSRDGEVILYLLIGSYLICLIRFMLN